MAPFTLNFAEPVSQIRLAPLTYDEVRQLNVLPDGALAVSEMETAVFWSATSSKAGSKTHQDDTD